MIQESGLFPLPTKTSVPTRMRTMLRRNPSAVTTMLTRSGGAEKTSHRMRVRTGDAASQCAARKAEKSCRPRRSRAASFIAGRSKRGRTFQDVRLSRGRATRPF